MIGDVMSAWWRAGRPGDSSQARRVAARQGGQLGQGKKGNCGRVAPCLPTREQLQIAPQEPLMQHPPNASDIRPAPGTRDLIDLLGGIPGEARTEVLLPRGHLS
jgi:hypothetical protein